jgi:hypothetical protein
VLIRAGLGGSGVGGMFFFTFRFFFFFFRPSGRTGFGSANNPEACVLESGKLPGVFLHVGAGRKLVNNN